MRHLQGSGMWFQVASRSGYRTFRVNVATSILYTVADLFLVNIQSDVIHSLHGGASLVVSESAWSLSSAFVHQALLLTCTFKQSGSSPWARSPCRGAPR